ALPPEPSECRSDALDGELPLDRPALDELAKARDVHDAGQVDDGASGGGHGQIVYEAHVLRAEVEEPEPLHALRRVAPSTWHDQLLPSRLALFEPTDAARGVVGQGCRVARM